MCACPSCVRQSVVLRFCFDICIAPNLTKDADSVQPEADHMDAEAGIWVLCMVNWIQSPSGFQCI